MSSRVSKWPGLAVLAAVVCSGGCIMPRTPKGYNQDRYRNNYALRQAAKGLPGAVGSLNSSAIRGQRDSMAKVLRDVKIDFFEDSLAPAHSESGKRVHEAYGEFLRAHDDVLDKHLARMIQVLEDRDASPEFKQQEVTKEWQAIGTLMARVEKDLKDALDAMYKEHNLQSEAPKMKKQPQPGGGPAP